jgi:hypothetical protein
VYHILPIRYEYRIHITANILFFTRIILTIFTNPFIVKVNEDITFELSGGVFSPSA